MNTSPKFSYKLKHVPSDFYVSEILYIEPMEEACEDKYKLFKLCKSNYTTFDAVNRFAKHFHLDGCDVSYAGLKDEDGITEQHITVAGSLNIEKIKTFNEDHFNHASDFIKVQYLGERNQTIKIGQLSGNNFRLIIRNLSEAEESYFKSNHKSSIKFINYYGSQRFGLPNVKKNTHILGLKIIENDYDSAIKILSQQPSTAGHIAKKQINNKLSGKQFFEELDPKLVAFYQSAYHSFEWNQKIKEYVLSYSSTIHKDFHEEIEYFYTQDSLDNIPNFLPYTRVEPHNKEFKNRILSRQTKVQLNLTVHRTFADIFHEGKRAAEVSFMLPTGVYATVAIRQLFFNIYCYIANSAEFMNYSEA